MKIKIEAVQIGEIKAATEKSRIDAGSIGNILNRDIYKSGFSLAFKEKFYYELGMLLKSGLDLLESIKILGKNQKKKKGKEFFHCLVNDLEGGESLSAALLSTEKFSAFEVYSIQVAEATGKFSFICEELFKYFQRSIKFRKQLIGAISYPFFILGFSFLVVFVLLKYLVPLFSGVYKKFGGELPTITQKLVALSNFFTQYTFHLVLTMFILGVLVFLIRNTLPFRKFTSKILLGIPLFGPVIKKLYLAKFTQIMALMIRSKIPLLSSIEFAQKIITFYPVQSALNNAERDILKGHSISKTLEQSNFFPISFISLITVGEETNSLDHVFNNLSEQYNREIEQSTDLLNKLLEPVLIVFLGLIIGFILVAMYLPLFQMSTRFH